MIIHKLFNTLKQTKLLSIFPRHNLFKTANISTSSCLYKRGKGKQRLTCEPRCCPESKMEISKKNALILGGTSGIGFETAHWLLLAGCKHVVIAGRNEDKCKEVVKILKRCHGKRRASCIRFDVRDPRECEESLMYTVDKVTNLEILVNCIGMLNGQEWEEEICLNVNCLIRETLLAYDFMGTDSVGFGGIIINMAGTMGVEPMTGAPTFAACKHAVVGFCRSYGTPATEAETKVRLVTLCPGYTKTRFWEELNKKAMTNFEGELERNIISAIKQMPQVCGKAVLYLAKYAETGTVWVIEGSELYELEFPLRKCFSRHAQTLT